MVCILLSHLLSSGTYQDILFINNGECANDRVDQPTLNHLECIWKWVIRQIWRLKMSKVEMVNDIVLIFKMTFQLTIGGDSLNIENSGERTGHGDRLS